MRTVIVDYSVMMHQSWHQMFSPNYVASHSLTRKDELGRPEINTELEEFLLNLSRNLFYIKCRFQPDEFIFALDADVNWRKYYIESYYDSRLVLYKDKSEDLKHLTYYSVIDDVIWKFERFFQTMQWAKYKVNTKDSKELNFTDESRFDKIDDMETIKSMELWEACMRFTIPYYKDHRALGVWKAVTPKSEWKKACVEYAPSIASILGASMVRVPYAEGDDIVATAVFEASSSPEDEVIVVSIDQDLYQLSTLHPNFAYYNPVTHKIVDLNPDEARFKLLCKIAGGDGSDNITGIKIAGNCLKEVAWTTGGDIRTGKTTVSMINGLIRSGIDKGLTGSKLYQPAYDYLEKMAEDDTFYKNLVCVYLKNIPDDLQYQIAEALAMRKIPKSNFKFIDLGIDQKTKISIMNKATNDAKEDGEE